MIIDKLTKEQLYKFIDVFDCLILKELDLCRAYDKESFIEDFLATVQELDDVCCFYVDVKRKGWRKRNSQFFYIDKLFFNNANNFHKLNLKHIDGTTFMLDSFGNETLEGI